MFYSNLTMISLSLLSAKQIEEGINTSTQLFADVLNFGYQQQKLESGYS